MQKYFWPLGPHAVAFPDSTRESVARCAVEPSNSIPSSAHVSDTGKADSSEWFYSQRGDVYGPVSTVDLCAAAHLGFLGPDDLVRPADAGTWVTARSVKGLFERYD